MRRGRGQKGGREGGRTEEGKGAEGRKGKGEDGEGGAGRRRKEVEERREGGREVGTTEKTRTELLDRLVKARTSADDVYRMGEETLLTFPESGACTSSCNKRTNIEIGSVFFKLHVQSFS